MIFGSVRLIATTHRDSRVGFVCGACKQGSVADVIAQAEGSEDVALLAAPFAGDVARERAENALPAATEWLLALAGCPACDAVPTPVRRRAILHAIRNGIASKPSCMGAMLAPMLGLAMLFTGVKALAVAGFVVPLIAGFVFAARASFGAMRRDAQARVSWVDPNDPSLL